MNMPLSLEWKQKCNWQYISSIKYKYDWLNWLFSGVGDENNLTQVQTLAFPKPTTIHKISHHLPINNNSYNKFNFVDEVNLQSADMKFFPAKAHEVAP